MESTVSFACLCLPWNIELRHILSIVDGTLNRGKFDVAVDKSIKSLLCTEDLDGDGLITVDDHGPKVLASILGAWQDG